MASSNSISRNIISIAIPAVSLLCALSQPSTANAASFNCGNAHTAFEKKVCSVPALSARDATMAASYDTAMHALSDPGKTILRNGQQRWRDVVSRLCLGNKGNGGPARCLRRRYDSRIEALHSAAVTIGPFLFSRIDTYQLAGKETTSGMPFELYRGVPRIDQPQSEIARQWNAKMAQAMAAVSKQAFWCSGGEDEVSGDDFVDFDIRAATADLISVRVSHAEVCDDGHYFPADKNLTYLLKPSVHPIKATDIFRPGSGWEKFLGNRAIRKWTDAGQGMQMKADSPFTGKINEDVRDPTSWSFTKQALIIVFNPGDATATAEGIVEMRVPWGDLQRYLLPGAPIPQ